MLVLLISLSKETKTAILRYSLIGWGIINIPLGVYTGLGLGNPTNLPIMHHDVSLVYEHMLSAIYIPLGICAILAAVNPVRHKLLILFVIVSSFSHAGIMTYDALTTHLMTWDGITKGPLTLYGTGIWFSIIFPREITKNGD